MADSFYQAYVEILPDFSKMYAEVKSGMTKVASQAGDDAGVELGNATKSGFNKSFLGAGAVAGVVSSVTSQIMSDIGALASDAIAASDATDKFKKTLSFAGIGSGEIADVAKATRSYADQTVYDLATIQNTTAQLAANGVPDYEKLTEAAGNLNAVAGGNANTFQSVGMVLTQTAGAGKLTTENWNQLANAIPGASGMIQDALLKNGAYTGNFRDAMEKGQISSEEFNAALMELGSQPVAVEAARSVETFEGAAGNLAATVTGYLSDALNAVKPVITGFMTAISDGLTWLVQNYWVIGGIAAAILTLLAPSIWAAVTATWAWTVALLANPLVWIAIAIGAVVGALIWFFTQTELGRQIWDAAMQAIGAMFNWLWTSVIQPVAQFIGDAIGVLGQVIGWLWENAIKPAIDAIGAIFTWLWEHILGPIVGFIIWNIQVLGAIIAWLWEVAVQPALKAIGGVFTWVWENIIKPITDSIGSAIQTMGDVIGQVFGAIGGVVKGAFDGVVSFVRDVVFNPIISLVNGVIDGVNMAAKTARYVGLNLPTLDKIPMLATGGTIDQGGWAVVGERGPELVNLPTGSTVFDAKQTASVGATQQTFEIHAVDPFAAALEIARLQRFGVA